jgi:hypothetical protein
MSNHNQVRHLLTTSTKVAVVAVVTKEANMAPEVR